MASSSGEEVLMIISEVLPGCSEVKIDQLLQTFFGWSAESKEDLKYLEWICQIYSPI